MISSIAVYNSASYGISQDTAFKNWLSKVKKTGKTRAILVRRFEGVESKHKKGQKNQRVTTVPLRGDRSSEARSVGSRGRSNRPWDWRPRYSHSSPHCRTTYRMCE